ncbi:MAG: hypothetical protein J5958_06590 [Clostridia bacterium]|nr:hypothetical protein [Clostridia bacterium]
MWEYYNPNPCGRSVGDCAVRAVARALNIDWETAYAIIAKAGYEMCDMPSSDSVWGAVLRKRGFIRKVIPDGCPNCYTAEDFCNVHLTGTYVLGFGQHAATVVDGVIYDAWNSSKEVPQYYWEKVRKEIR